MTFSGRESRGTLDASHSLVRECLLKFQSTIDDIKNLLKQVFEIYLECVRLNQGTDDVASAKILHSVNIVHSFLCKWVEATMGMKFGIKSQWTGVHWSTVQAASEIKVILLLSSYLLHVPTINL